MTSNAEAGFVSDTFTLWQFELTVVNYYYVKLPIETLVKKVE